MGHWARDYVLKSTVDRFKRKIANKTALEIEKGLRYETIKFYDTIRFALLDKSALQTLNVVI